MHGTTLSSTLAVALLLGPAATAAPAPEDPGEVLTRGKLELDVGYPKKAAQAFAQVLSDPAASEAQRWEAQIRLAVARRLAGDWNGSVNAFLDAWQAYRGDPDALRFLLASAGSALPGPLRWEKVWRDISLDIDRSDPPHPTVRVRWPGVPPRPCLSAGEPAACRWVGDPIEVRFTEADLQDVFALMADISGLNVVVNPGTQGLATLYADSMPWDEALARMLAPNGLIARRQGNVVWIGAPADALQSRAFGGRPIDFEYKDTDLRDALREIAAHGDARVEIPEGVAGRVTFKLIQVPWDQAFDLLAHVNGLTWERTGNAIRVAPRRR